MSQDDFLFGAQSALRYEEYNILKTNRRKQRQKRVLVIDGHQIYHQKQLIDPKSGLVRQPLNYIPSVQPILCDENGNIIPDQILNTSSAFGSDRNHGGKQPKKVGYYKAKISNLMKTGFGKSKKKNVRFVQNIITIRQILDDEGLQTNKFEIIYKTNKPIDFKEARLEEDMLDRKVLYESENIETASYIVAKIKTQM